MTLFVTMNSEISDDKHEVKGLKSSPVSRGMTQGYTVFFPILIAAIREYMYCFNITVHHYTDDTMINRKDIPHNH